MALGGGIFVTQNKKLPGAYINFTSAARANASLSDRGIGAMPLVLDWGAEGVVKIDHAAFMQNSRKYTGYEYTHEKNKGLRDFFKKAQTLFVYRLNKGVKASNSYAMAKYAGVRGNDLKIVITANADDESMYDVMTYLDTRVVDTQTVAEAAALVGNEFVDFVTSTPLALTASTPLSGGTNGDEVTGQDWQDALNALDRYSYNTLGVVSTDDTVKGLCVAYTKRMRDEVGAKFQCVVYKKNDADYEGVISVENKVTDAAEESMVFWATGAEAGCKVNQSLDNMEYDGEFSVDVNYTQAQLEEGIDTGKFMFHAVGDDVNVLLDLNTFTSFTKDKGEDFQNNQVIRTLDQIGIDFAVAFNKQFLGKENVEPAGLNILYLTYKKLLKQLERLTAIKNFADEDLTLAEGEKKGDVVTGLEVEPTVSMRRLYMTCVVS